MPVEFTDSLVEARLERHGLDQSGSMKEKRERLARYIEEHYQDPIEAWEIRTGKPWNKMTTREASILVLANPELSRNPGILGKLLGG